MLDVGLIDVIGLIIVVEYLLHRAFNHSLIVQKYFLPVSTVVIHIFFLFTYLFSCRTDYIELNNTLPHSYYENAKIYYSEAQKYCCCCSCCSGGERNDDYHFCNASKYVDNDENEYIDNNNNANNNVHTYNNSTNKDNQNSLSRNKWNLEPFFVYFSDDDDYLNRTYYHEVDNHDAYIVSSTEYSDYITLLLMSLFDGAILSGSSFSWWGAYLQQNEHNYYCDCHHNHLYPRHQHIDHHLYHLNCNQQKYVIIAPNVSWLKWPDDWLILDF